LFASAAAPSRPPTRGTTTCTCSARCRPRSRRLMPCGWRRLIPHVGCTAIGAIDPGNEPDGHIALTVVAQLGFIMGILSVFAMPQVS
jgi:hypothetical protein